MTRPNALVLPTPLADRIASYLAQRPYIEVHELIDAMRALAPLTEPPAEPAATEPTE